MFSITATSPAIENLTSELVLTIERLANETPPPDEATREIAMAPELIDLHSEELLIQ